MSTVVWKPRLVAILATLAIGACTSPAATQTAAPQTAAPPTASSSLAPPAAATATAVPGASPSPASASAGPSRAPLTAGEPWIAYQAITPQRGGLHTVHLVRPDGTDAFFALDMIPGREQLHPDWSFDGSQLLVDVNDTTNTPDIWLADLNSWSARKLVDCSAPCLWVQEPAWSRDAMKIAYQRHLTTDEGELSQIEVLDLASGTTSVVFETIPDRGVYAPRWSPDARSLVFEQTASNGGAFLGVSLEVLDLANPKVSRTIVPVQRQANNSDWSPDGSVIAFSAPIKGGEPGGALSDIWVVKPDGSNARQMTDVAASGGTAIQPTFTPDGRSIMFKLTDSRLGASDAMATVPVAGGHPQPATGSAYLYGWHPRLRPTP